jgi:hypothetical protein
MQRTILIFFEIIMLALLIICWQHAKRNGGWPSVWGFLAGVIFGWLLEWATIIQLEAYEYGNFILKVGPLPLSIGIGWGVIIYSARLFSDARRASGQQGFYPCEHIIAVTSVRPRSGKKSNWLAGCIAAAIMAASFS